MSHVKSISYLSMICFIVFSVLTACLISAEDKSCTSSSRCTIWSHANVYIEVKRTGASQFFGFKVRVDEYSLLVIPVGKVTIEESTEIVVYVGDQKSPAKKFKSGTTNVAFLSAVVNLDVGKTNKIAFADSCPGGDTCYVGSSETCIDNQCAVKSSGSDEDIRVYIGWQGTDLILTSLRSATLIPTKYRFYTIPSFLKKMITPIAEFTYDFSF